MDVPAFSSQPVQPAQRVLAGKSFGSRVVTYIIDSVIQVIVSGALTFMASFMIGVILYALGEQFSVTEGNFFENFLIATVTTIGYYFFFEWMYDATPAKLMLGMRVVKEDGSPCDARAAIVRGLYRYVDGFFFALVAYNAMKPPSYQRRGDKSAKTVVVARDALTGPTQLWWRFAIALVFYLMIEGAASVVMTLRTII